MFLYLYTQEFYIPSIATSIDMFKTKICIGCSKGFEVVDLDTLETHGIEIFLIVTLSNTIENGQVY